MHLPHGNIPRPPTFQSSLALPATCGQCSFFSPYLVQLTHLSSSHRQVRLSRSRLKAVLHHTIRPSHSLACAWLACWFYLMMHQRSCTSAYLQVNAPRGVALSIPDGDSAPTFGCSCQERCISGPLQAHDAPINRRAMKPLDVSGGMRYSMSGFLMAPPGQLRQAILHRQEIHLMLSSAFLASILLQSCTAHCMRCSRPCPVARWLT